jgi:hypothetical protein
MCIFQYLANAFISAELYVVSQFAKHDFSEIINGIHYNLSSLSLVTSDFGSLSSSATYYRLHDDRRR